MRYADAELALEVTDVGDVAPDPVRPLLGMRERVALYGGDLVAEPVAGVRLRGARAPAAGAGGVSARSQRTLDIALTAAILVALP